PVERAVLTHAHGDHARAGSGAYLCTPETAALLRRRLGDASIETLRHGERRVVGSVTVSLHPAGHMLGSAQVRIERRAGGWVVSVRQVDREHGVRLSETRHVGDERGL